MAFCYALLLWASGLVAFWGGAEGHTRQANTPEGHNSGLVETPPTATAAGGTHPTGMHSCLKIQIKHK